MATTVWLRTNFMSNSIPALNENAAIRDLSPLIIRLKSSTAGSPDEDFALPYNPLQIRYGALSDEIAQIPRPGTTPIIAFKAHRLMTIDFTFILAYPGDGLSQSVDAELETLRRFAASGDRVVELLNFDTLTNSPFSYRNKSQERFTSGLFFSIVEMSVESVRRNKNNQITQANVTLSLIENRNPRISPTFIPPLRPVAQQNNCNNPVWAAKPRNKARCRKKPVATPRVPSATSQSNSTAAETLPPGITGCYWVGPKQLCPGDEGYNP